MIYYSTNHKVSSGDVFLILTFDMYAYLVGNC